MKTINLIIGILLLSVSGLFAQTAKTDSITVQGNCGMCKDRIEKAAKSVDSVTAAEWNKETKMLELTYDESKTNIHKAHLAIAKVGHDTDIHKAKDEVYNNLPGCCKYDRPKVKQNDAL